MEKYFDIWNFCIIFAARNKKKIPNAYNCKKENC